MSSDEELNKTFIEGLELEFVACFRRDLKEEIQFHIPELITLKETTKNAIEIERNLNATVYLRKNQSFLPETNNFFNRVTFTKESIKCQICVLVGHNARTCRRYRSGNQYSPYSKEGSSFRLGIEGDRCNF